MNSVTKDTAAGSDDVLDISALLHLALRNIRVIVICAILFLIAAVAWTSFRGPVYEATAFLEVDDSREVATIAQKLRFPSVYHLATDGESEAAAALARRTRVKVIRDSRLIAVTVRGKDPKAGAVAADAVVAAFLSMGEKSDPAPDLEPVETFELPLNDSLPLIRSGAFNSVSPEAWQVEKATVPAHPAGPMNVLLWVAAAAAGAFSGFVFALLRHG